VLGPCASLEEMSYEDIARAWSAARFGNRPLAPCTYGQNARCGALLERTGNHE